VCFLNGLEGGADGVGHVLVRAAQVRCWVLGVGFKVKEWDGKGVGCVQVRDDCGLEKIILCWRWEG
jgi:hypothetical protein